MEDKRRIARIQGNWRSQPRPMRKSEHDCSSLRPLQMGELREQTPVTPFGNQQQPKLVYTETTKVSRCKPPDLFIEKEGHHILSTSCKSDVCSILLFPDFIADASERSSIFHTLLHSIPWEEKSVVINGQMFPMPRKVAWYGPIPYRFSGTTMPTNAQFPSVMQYLHDQILSATGHEFNSVLLNLYRNGKDSVAWHSDDELLMGVNPIIASLSFGETRMFEMREKLEDHRIPKEFHDRKARINLTFRTVFPKSLPTTS